MNRITEKSMKEFEESLSFNEKSNATITKYITAVRRLSEFLAGGELTKQKLLDYREHLLKVRKPQTVNGVLSAVNSYLDFAGMEHVRVKLLKVQHAAFLSESRELSEAEYRRLLAEAKNRQNERLYLLMQTLCGTGIRVSELEYITVEAARDGRAEIRSKGKNRVILLPRELRRKLSEYAKQQKIRNGFIFRTRNDRPLDRSNVCHDMKLLCRAAKVDAKKVFSHNLRHLFARTFYAVEKNLAHLADVLGHSRIETTRIYVAVSAAAHERVLNRMNLVL